MVKNFSYTPATIAALEETISSDRLTSYLAATQGNKAEALQLYAWNAIISAALYVPLQGLEVTLRNALHRELTQRFGVHWYDRLSPSLSNPSQNLIAGAKSTVTNSRKPLTPSRVIAELSFGFWVTLLSGKYHNPLWTPALYKAFPHLPPRVPRKHVHQPLDYLRLLRNRIAHHEPIFGRHLQKDYEHILELVGWMSPEKAAWVAHHNTVETILADKPG